MPKCKNTKTLFAYFTKSPKVVGSPTAAQTPGKENLSVSQTESASDEVVVRSRKRQEDCENKGSLKRKKTTSEQSSLCSFNEGDLVWAKLDGHPWWPSLVGKDPTDKKYYRTSRSKQKSVEVHVHFFGQPASRAWIKEKNVKSFDEDKDVAPKVVNSKWQLALTTAEESRKLPPDDRLSIILCSAPSEDDGEANDPDNPPDEIISECEEDDYLDSGTPQKRKANGKNEDKSLKRRRIIVVSEDEDSEEEFKPPVSEEESESEFESIAETDSEGESSKKTKTSINKKTTKNKTTTIKKTTVTPTMPIEAQTPRRSSNVSDKTKVRLSMFSSPNAAVASVDDSDNIDGRTFTHLKLGFLKKGQIRDSKKRHESDPDYDSKTLYVPEDFKNNLTPAMRQWWEMKSSHFNVILFFKVGKFYELYHMDAVIGVAELNLVFMKGDYAHSGFPEVAYGRYSASLIERGYRVARVEQTENPAMMEERCKKMTRPTKFDKVVKREICQITTKGTRRYGFLDAQTNESNPAYLFAVTENSNDSNAGGECEFGVCFVDTSIGKFRLGQFMDDRHGSRFRTLMSHIAPVQILYEKGALSLKTLQIIKNCSSNAIIDPLVSKKEFWESDKTLKFLFEEGYFNGEDDAKGEVIWPELFATIQDKCDNRGLTAKREYAMAIQALGACTWYLCDSFLDQELLSMRNFELYIPVDVDCCTLTTSSQSVASFFHGKRNMVLDGITLKNLDILQNNSTGTLEGTLLAKLDHCSTLAGKRLIRQWICAPLCDVEAIDERLNAIDDLMKHKEIVDESVDLLKKLPDLERLLSKIHTQGSALRSKTHPDSRAMFYEDNTYSKRKILDFLSALRGFKTATEIVDVFSKVSDKLKSKLLRRCVMVDVGGMFPDLEQLLIFFDNAFDHEKAKREGKIFPSKGVDADYDTAVAEIKELGKRLDSYLEKQCDYFCCKVSYVGSARNRFQLEVPDRAYKRADNRYELQGQRKGFKRYWTAETKELLALTMNAEDSRDSALRDIMRRIFATFAKDYVKWDQAVQCLASLDVLISLAHYSQCGSNTMCRPNVRSPSDDSRPFIKISDGCHPCISTVFSGGDFISNNTYVGVDEDELGHSSSANVVLVTGPNMGGKSTLMRQIGLIVIVAQLGCYVPASECHLTPVDRVFTRLGASDRIMQGESTFFVELSETACILRHASTHSLVLIDELGRGTSTYDGVAIAHAVVRELADRIRCRTFFSTHYHSLVDQFNHKDSCQLGHMACLVENENEEDPTEETITFLYKFVPGACPKSYGFNAAKLAGIPTDVIKVAHRKAKEIEEITEAVKVFRTLNQESNPGQANVNLAELVSSIKLR